MTEATLLSSLKAHDSFFARIIDMIPTELYRHSLSEDTDNAENTKYYKHRKLPLTADEKKILSKQKKAEKYAPPVKASKKTKTESDEEGESSAEEEEQSSEDEAEDSSDEHEAVVTIPSSSSVKQVEEYTSCNDLDTLRQRLQNRIQSMKGTRTSVKPHKVQAQEAADSKKANGTSDATGKNDKKDKKNNKKRKKGAATEATETEPEEAVKAVKAQKTATSTPNTAPAVVSESETPAAKAEKIAADLEFNNMLMIGDTSSISQTGVDKNKGKPGSKVARLKRLLEEAQYKREKLTAMAKSDDPDEQQAMKNVKWSDALKSASGNKSLLIAGSGSGMDAEAKIKKALKRREKSKQKSAEEWKARLDAVEESKTARIDKRENNLQVRKNTKAGIVPEAEAKDKDAAKTGPKNTNNNINNTKSNNTHTEKKEGGAGGAKGRAGFEGKKKEFLNKSGGGGGGGKQQRK